ncbi:hypothetical protein IV203_003189 [Nitzschia inconspicua]|uniref:STI1/HOP DP domain-containing protein n=1 Tax=Nitzschia inconspicua TaxID=303405 RepID=A0A9K3PQT3_9STRA|nr:hypothetical protein IV203_003189 [Nitzschia inconspicua]
MRMQSFLSLLLLLPVACRAFLSQLSFRCQSSVTPTTSHHLSSSDDFGAASNLNEGEEEEDDVEPGQMRISEIKSELDMRGISYADCFDKESLAGRLVEARATGRANPEIIDKFNKAKLEQTFREEKLEIKDEDLQRMTANDGTLPGGLSPETFQKMVGNPELMALLQSTKMQEAMKFIMTGGPQDLEEAMKADPELRETLSKLNEVMGKLGPLESNS